MDGGVHANTNTSSNSPLFMDHCFVMGNAGWLADKAEEIRDNDNEQRMIPFSVAGGR